MVELRRPRFAEEYRIYKKGSMYPGIQLSRSFGDLSAKELGLL